MASFQCTGLTVTGVTTVNITNLTGTDLGGGVVQLQWDQDVAANIDVKDNGAIYATLNIGVPGAQSVNLQGIIAGYHTFCVEKAA